MAALFNYSLVRDGFGTYVYFPIVAVVILYAVLLAKSSLSSVQVGDESNQVLTALVRSYRRKLRMAKMLFCSAIFYSLFYFSYPIVGKTLPIAAVSAHPMLCE